MQAYRTFKTVPDGKSLILDMLPFRTGEEVEIIILPITRQRVDENPYPLRSIPIAYNDPTEPVAEMDWEILK